MRILLTFLFVQFLISCTTQVNQSARPDSSTSFSIIQGSTTEDRTILRVIYPKALKVNYHVTNSKGESMKAKRVRSFTRKHSEFRVDHIRVTSLKITESYTLKVSSDSKKWQDERYFKALDTTKNQMSILVASCMSDSYNEIGNDIWPKAFSHKPDVSFLIGDNIYADTFSGIYLGSSYLVKPHHLWNRYVDHAMKLKMNRMKHLVPTYITWDDHDYGKNNGGREYPYKKESKEILNIFFPREKSKHLGLGPGVSSRIRLGGMNFLFLDGRSFRSIENNENGPHFGKKQRKWIRKNLDSKKFNWLISGDQFFGGYHRFESFQGNHSKTFQSFLEDINQYKVLFLSGDRHLLEAMKIPSSMLGYETYEYTASGIHTKMYPGSLKSSPNPYRLDGFDGVANYAIIKTNMKENKLNILFEGHSPKGLKTSLTHDLSL